MSKLIESLEGLRNPSPADLVSLLEGVKRISTLEYQLFITTAGTTPGGADTLMEFLDRRRIEVVGAPLD